MKIDKKEFLSIPNILTYFRILCVPIFIALSVIAGQRSDMNFVYGALAVFVIAATTDLIDGKIARHYNMVTKIGMMLDPLADKLMHMSMVLCLAFAIKMNGVPFLHWGFVVAILVKELSQIALSGICAKTGVVMPANAMGKIASATLSAGIILTFFHPYVAPWDWAVMAVATCQTYYAFFTYLKIGVKQMIEIKKKKDNGEKIDDEIVVDTNSEFTK